MRTAVRHSLLALTLLASGGCLWEQVFLFGVDVEMDFPSGEWTDFTCVRFPSMQHEILEGEYIVSGQLALGESERRKLPRKVRVRTRATDALGQAFWEETRLVKIDRPSGEFKEAHVYPETVTFPAGTELCWSAKFFRPGFDGRVVWFDRSMLPVDGPPS